MRVFVAGASGVIGRPLVALLVGAGHDVAGSTRSRAGAAILRRLGARPVVLDVFDAPALASALAEAAPEVTIHQLTDLPDRVDPAALAAMLEANARIRREGTRNLMAAARYAGVRRCIAQSIAFAYAPGPRPHREDDPLLPATDVTAAGVRALERAVTGTPGIDGIVLRYGRLYGPGTWTETAKGPAALPVDAAAHAAFLAVARGAPRIYNIAEADGAVAIDKARAELGFDPAFRIGP